jgi:hypothetical protein
MSDYKYYDNSITNHDIIESDFNDHEIMLVKEELSHDGFDKDGPKSNLYDLWILEKTYDDYIIHLYHYENWFNSKYNNQYKLVDSYKLSKLSNNSTSKYIYNKLLEFADLTNSKNLKLQLILLG